MPKYPPPPPPTPATELELLFLGTGTSAGIPMIGCHCPVCTSTDPHDTRTRASVLIRFPDPSAPHSQTRQILIDASPDLRTQCLRENINHLDAVLYTHSHADHIMGTDDLRRFNAVQQQPLDIYADPPTLEVLARMFRYIFEPHTNVNQSFVASLIPHTLTHNQPFTLFGVTFTPLLLLHGRLPITGFRIDHNHKSIAYCTDVSSIPPETLPHLTNLDALVLDGLRHKHHPTHLTIDRACQYAEQLNAKQTYLTHIAHEVSHAQVSPQLPHKVFLGADGLRV
ncbi:MBL fold metallo-hydrolase [Mucisphaera sp.]|uniref:MBL fold metallo-hydrolase n=1 Tax=Mucisphaera sp. TaxID=2913024 RepID=UPI003D0BDBFD